MHERTLDLYSRINTNLLNLHEELLKLLFGFSYRSKIIIIRYHLDSLKELERELEKLSDKDFFKKITKHSDFSSDFWWHFRSSYPSDLITGLIGLYKILDEVIENPGISIEIRNRLKEINRKIDERYEEPLLKRIRRSISKVEKIHYISDEIEKAKIRGIIDELLLKYFLEHE
jgi:hypothetical protein